MKKFKLDKKISTRIAALCTAGLMIVTMSSCGKKKEETKNDYSSEISTVNTTIDNIENLLPELNEESEKNTSIILLLDMLAKEDENGKIHTDVISNLKSKIDSDNMIDEFNSFLDVLENTIIKNGKVLKISEILPENMKTDKEILSRLEKILENVIKYSNEKNKDGVVSEFNKIYDLFVNENEIEIDGLKFDIRDLAYGSREVANTYAEMVAYYAFDYVDINKIKSVDNRTNNQNSKAYIKSKLDILNNEIDEKSETDVIKLFNDKYTKSIDPSKVSLSNTQKSDLVNILNMKYLDSDKVATKDKNILLGEYSEEKITNVLTCIDAINTYNQNNQKNIIPYSTLLVDNYTNTDNGKVDRLALNFVQYNSIMLLNSVNENTTFYDLSLNPYYNNLYKYITKQNLTHVEKDSNGKQISTNIVWQEISDGVNFVNYETILNTLNKINVKEVSMENGIIDKAKRNLSESILYIQNTITGECQKVNTDEFVKIKK